MAENNVDVKKMPFERAIEELESIVKRLEEGKVPLEGIDRQAPGRGQGAA